MVTAVPGHRTGISRRMRRTNAASKAFAVGANAYQRLNLAAKTKAHRREAKTENRSWEIRPSGMIEGPRENVAMAEL